MLNNLFVKGFYMGMFGNYDGRYLLLHNDKTGEDCIIDKVESRHRRLACGFMNWLKMHRHFLKHIILTQSYEQYKPKHINAFMSKMRRYYGKLHYLWTVEVQMERLKETGEAVLHWHILLGFPSGTSFGSDDIKRIQQYWKFGDMSNSVEIRPVKHASVSYLMKYITKALDCPLVNEYQVRRIGSSLIPGYLRQSWNKVVRVIQHFAAGGLSYSELGSFIWQNGNAYLWEESEIGGYLIRLKHWIYRKQRSEWYKIESFDGMPF
jgi:hypothetical protein